MGTTRNNTARRRIAAVVDTCEPRRLLASVSGVVFNDVNKNGVRDSGDNGVGGITVFADKNYDGVMQATELRAVTDSNGFYRISGIVADNTSTGIRLSGVAASRITAPASGGHSARFASDYEAAGRNFGVAPAASSTGRIVFRPYWDRNGSGGPDAADQVFVEGTAWVDLNSDYVRQAGEPLLSVTPSAPDGGLPGYVSGDLAPGTYRVVYKPASYVANDLYAANATVVGGATPATANLKLPAVQRTSEESESVTLRPFRDADGDGEYDAGETIPADAVVWVEFDGDNVRDADEPLLVYNAAAQGYGVLIPSPGGARFAVRLAGDADLVADATLDRSYAPMGYAREEYIALPAAPSAPSATVTGTVYNDADKDGVLDAGESRVSGVTVYADLNFNGVRESNEPITTTNASGVYSLTGIPLSNTSVAIRAIAPAGQSFTVPSGGVQSGRYSAAITYANRNFGLTGAVAPTGGVQVQATFDRNGDNNVNAGEDGPADATVWADLNRNGLRESSEPLLSLIGTAPEGPSPIFGLSGLTPGSYSIALRLAGDADSYADYKVEVTVYAGGNTGALILIPVTSSLGGIVYNDANGNGAKDAGESGTSGVVVFADYDFDGIRDANEPQTTTNSSGVYKLYGIRSDNNPFRITPILPAGSSFTNPAAGYYQARFDRAYDLADQGGRDFGYKAAPVANASVSGVVFYDFDRDGVRDGGEAGVQGATVYADRNYNGAFDAGEPIVNTDANGRYTLSIPTGPNSVAIRLAVPADRITSPAGGIYSGKYPAPYNVQNANFGLAPEATAVTGRVFLDADRDGVQDAGEGWAGGVTVFADLNGNGVYDSSFDTENPEPTAVTDAEGRFTFERTRTAPFSIGVVDLEVPSYPESPFGPTRGFLQTTADAPVNPADASTRTGRLLGAVGASVIDVKPRVVPRGGNGTFGPDLTELALRDVGPFTGFLDRDGDGVRDADEVPELNFYKQYPDGDGTWGYKVVVADGVTARFGIAADGAVGAAAEAVVNVVGQPDAQTYFPELAPRRSVVVGKVFEDYNRNGVLDGTEGSQLYLEADSYVFADYDGDNVLDAGEPSASPFGLYTRDEDSGLIGYFILNVDPNREFTLRVRPRFFGSAGQPDFVQSPAAPKVTVAPRSAAGVYDVGYYYLT